MLSSLHGFVDSVVAVDGAFRTFPDAHVASKPEQAAAFAEGCHDNSLELMLYQPKAIGRWLGRFKGDEVPKRNASLHLCQVFNPDWVVVIDPDMLCVSHEGVRDLMEWTNKKVIVSEVEGATHRHIFRWTPTLRYVRAHYVVADGELTLAAPHFTPITGKLGPVQEALDLRDILLFDHPEKKDFWRRAMAESWYKIRDKGRDENLFPKVN